MKKDAKQTKQRTQKSGVWCKECRKTIPFDKVAGHKHNLSPTFRGEPVAQYIECVICGKKTNHVEIINGKGIPVHKTECAAKLREQELQKIGFAYCVYCRKETPYKNLQCTICGNARLGT